MNQQGYHISEAMVGGVALFSAWTPNLGKDEHAALLRERYAIGESVPQARQLIGVFASIEAAAEACAT